MKYLYLSTTPNSITKTFIEQVKSLVDSGKAASQVEIVNALNWNKSMMSEVMNGRKNVPLAVYRKFASYYKLPQAPTSIVNDPEPTYTADFRDKYIASLEKQTKSFEDQISSLKGQLRHLILITHAKVETNQHALADLLVKQKIEPAETVEDRLSKENLQNYQKLKSEMGIL